MADNIVLNAGSGGSTLAADDITSVWYQIVKVAFGALDTATLVTTSAGLPVDLRASNASQAVTNAGTFAVQADSVIPGSGATNLGKAEDAAHASGDIGVAVWGVRDDTLSVFSGLEGDYEPFHMTSTGRLYTSATVDAALPAGTNNIGDVDVLTLPALPAGTNNIGDVDVLTVITGTGATNLGKAEDAVHTTGDTGVYALAVRDDSPAAHSGTDGDYESLHTDANGALWVTLIPKGTGGCSFFKSIDLDETEEEIKATAATFKGGIVMNLTAALIYFKMYNATAATVVVGTTVPDLTIPIPGNNDTDGAGFIIPVPPEGVEFTTALTVAATTGIADADAGAPAANAVAVALWYE